MGLFEQLLEDSFEEEEVQEESGIDLTGPQTEFFLSELKFPLFVAGFGSGKTQCLCTCALRDVFDFPGANIAVYAPTYDLLKLVAMAYIEEVLTVGGYSFTLNNSDHTFKIEGYGKIICRSMDNPGRIVAYEVFRSHCDELDILEEPKARLAWQKIIARNRQKVYKRDENGKKIPKLDKNFEFVFKKGKQQFETELNRVCAYTTPEGFQFVYKRWVEEPDPKGHYGMIRASTYSNEQNLPDDYIETLRASYPAELVDAYIEGLFVNLTSGRVYRKFNRDVNCSAETVQGNERLHIGIDFNIEHGAAVIHVLRDGVPHAVDEVFDSYDTEDTISILQERYPDNPITVYPDATGKKRNSANGAPTATDISLLQRAGFFIEVDYSNPLVKDRVNCVNAKILNGKGEVSYFVNVEKCPNVVATLEQQVWDKNGQPDKTTGLDHIGDALGYFVCKMFPIIRQAAAFLGSTRR